MATYYEDPLYRVRQGIFTGWRVDYLPDETTFVPSTELHIRIGFLWRLIRKEMSRDTVPPRRLGEDVMFEWLARAAAMPHSPEAERLLGGEPRDALKVVLSEATYRSYTRSVGRNSVIIS